MADLKSRSKAMKLAVGVSGVESAAITGPEKNQVEVVGDGIDPVVLTKLIRKKVAYADIVSVDEVKKEKAAAETPPEAAETTPPFVWPFVPAPFRYRYSDGSWDYPSAYDVRDRDPFCNLF
ncbi:heavy metal-associated isoprenylated plant protein 16 isoform X2 [Primulina huaijiensis]